MVAAKERYLWGSRDIWKMIFQNGVGWQFKQIYLGS